MSLQSNSGAKFLPVESYESRGQADNTVTQRDITMDKGNAT